MQLTNTTDYAIRIVCYLANKKIGFLQQNYLKN